MTYHKCLITILKRKYHASIWRSPRGVGEDDAVSGRSAAGEDSSASRPRPLVTALRHRQPKTAAPSPTDLSPDTPNPGQPRFSGSFVWTEFNTEWTPHEAVFVSSYSLASITLRLSAITATVLSSITCYRPSYYHSYSLSSIISYSLSSITRYRLSSSQLQSSSSPLQSQSECLFTILPLLVRRLTVSRCPSLNSHLRYSLSSPHSGTVVLHHSYSLSSITATVCPPSTATVLSSSQLEQSVRSITASSLSSITATVLSSYHS
ncbi:unnamed protein product [Boreogadus saida]